MHYTALHNYSAAAGIPPAPAQRAPAMSAFTAISAASGELMVPENAGVVIQAKSGINAIRVSGTATTTAGVTGPGTTANQIQFYSNDTIVGAFDRLGLYTTGAVYTNSIKTTADTDLIISSYFGTTARAIQFRGVNSINSALQGRYGFCNASGWSFEDGSSPDQPLNLFTISKDGIIANRSLTTNGNIYARSITCSAGNSVYFNNPADTYSWSFKTDASNILHLVNQYGTDYMMCRDDMGVVHTQPTRTYSAGAIGSSGYIGTSAKGGGCPSLVLANDAAASNYNDLWSTGNFNIGFSDGKTLYASKGTGVWTYTSDFNLKTNIVSLSSTLQNILNLNPVNFNYKTEPNAPPIAGFIAQEVQTNFPLLVSRNILPDGTEDPYLSLSQTGLIPYIVKAIQEQHQEIMDLKSQLNELKSILNKLVK